MTKQKRNYATKERREYNLKYWKEHPAMNHYRRAQNRCLYDKNSYYYKKVRFDITVADVEKAWIRDNGESLLQPSIDRIDSSLGYIPDNIRFIELKENLGRKKYTGRNNGKKRNKKESK